VTVPARLSPVVALCLDGRRDIRGQCVEATYTGDYLPVPYLLPAVALKFSDRVGPASWLTRAGSAVPALGFLLLALLLLWDGTLWSLLGAAVAFSPMVLFVSSVLNPNALEIASVTAFLASLLRLARAPLDSPNWVWMSAALSGVIAVVSWQLGPVFVALDLLLFAALIGGSGLVMLRRQAGRKVSLTAGALLVAGLLYVLYGAASGLSHAIVRLDRIGDLHAGVDQLNAILHQAVGTFGALTVPLPPAVTYAWWALVALLLAIALKLAAPRERTILITVCGLALLFPVLFYAVVYRHTGFGLQGRYVLPVLMTAPLLAGEIIRRTPQSLSQRASRALIPGLIGAVAVLQFIAWWVNARAQAGRSTSIWFLDHTTWAPPLGWWPWVLAAAAGAALMVAACWPRPPAGAQPRPRPSG
jgi:hypothetical protein